MLREYNSRGKSESRKCPVNPRGILMTVHNVDFMITNPSPESPQNIKVETCTTLDVFDGRAFCLQFLTPWP
ncbi:MAG: hypothetical protein Cons2KO_30260 [Congregibacter sp.]